MIKHIFINKVALLTLLSSLSLFADKNQNAIRIANYNVENLFDLNINGNEYDEYIPNGGTGWNQQIYSAKLNNISKVISEVNPDVIGLEEIESRDALKDLQQTLRTYPYKTDFPYSAIAEEKKTKSAVTTALLSKYPIKYIKEVKVTNHPLNRNILEVGIDINGELVIVFVNHWKAKSGPESKRIQSAEFLVQRLNEIDKKTPYILLGDFNSNHDEFETFIKEKRLNDTEGKTGINHVLNTIESDDWKITLWFKNLFGMLSDYSFVSENSVKKSDEVHYNLWLELPEDEQWSYGSHKSRKTIDNMILPNSLYDGKGLDYIDNSFNVFRGAGTIDKRGKIVRWQRGKKKEHLGEGFSDHLLIYADFEIKK